MWPSVHPSLRESSWRWQLPFISLCLFSPQYKHLGVLLHKLLTCSTRWHVQQTQSQGIKGRTSCLTLNRYTSWKKIWLANLIRSGCILLYLLFRICDLIFAYPRFLPSAIPSDFLACPYQSVARHPLMPVLNTLKAGINAWRLCLLKTEFFTSLLATELTSMKILPIFLISWISGMSDFVIMLLMRVAYNTFFLLFEYTYAA